MTHLSTETLELILETLVTSPRWSSAAAAAGISEPTAFNWLARSRAAARAGDTASPFYLRWREVDDYWHVHCGRARRENIIAIEGVIRDQIQHGVREPLFDAAGNPVWMQDAEAVARWGDQIEGARAIDGLNDYPYAHDERGRRIQAFKVSQLPATTRNKALELISEYRPSSTVNVNAKVSSSSTVMHVGPRTPPRELPAPTAPQIDPDKAAAMRAAFAPELAKLNDPSRRTAPESVAAVSAAKGRPSDEPSESVVSQQPHRSDDNKLGTFSPLPMRHDGGPIRGEHTGLPVGTKPGLRHYVGK
jgi:hypothetical protein